MDRLQDLGAQYALPSSARADVRTFLPFSGTAVRFEGAGLNCNVVCSAMGFPERVGDDRPV
jgi:hypothetical protein